jgi:hypothetical protein
MVQLAKFQSFVYPFPKLVHKESVAQFGEDVRFKILRIIGWVMHKSTRAMQRTKEQPKLSADCGNSETGYCLVRNATGAVCFSHCSSHIEMF